MSSSRSASLLVTAAVLVLTGCGRSPATRTPVKVVRVDSRAAVLCNCDEDDDYDDDDDELDRPKARPVEYVKMTEWQPPPSAQRVEADIAPRGAEPPSYIQFPQLELHKPIDQPRPRAMRLYFGRKR